MELKINTEFKNLIRALTRKEYLQLEENLLADGCLNPIITWDGYIIDGHNRYEICTRHNIPFDVLPMEFSCKEAVIAWICKHQLGRRNLTEEGRKYLIGMQYEAEKIVNARKNQAGKNQYSTSPPETPSLEKEAPISKNKTAHIIADENHVTHATVQKYGIYCRALNSLRIKHPILVSNILSGRYKIAHKNVVDLSRMPNDQVESIENRMIRQKKAFVHYSTSRHAMTAPERKESVLPSQRASAKPTIKDMPAYDPDAPLIELSLTIPSWTGSIKRSSTNIILEETSQSARDKLVESLKSLKFNIDELLTTLLEKN